MEVTTAFLNGVPEEEIFMEIPKGFKGYRDSTKVCTLKRPLYGLKQASKA
jgi:hypothetical protein